MLVITPAAAFFRVLPPAAAQALLSSPQSDDPQDAVVARQYLNSLPEYEATARQWTQMYAHAVSAWLRRAFRKTQGFVRAGTALACQQGLRPGSCQGESRGAGGCRRRHSPQRVLTAEGGTVDHLLLASNPSGLAAGAVAFPIRTSLRLYSSCMYGADTKAWVRWRDPACV